MRLRTRTRWIAIAILPFLASCAAPTIKHEYEISPGREFNASMKTVLVLPLNQTREVETGLEQGIPATSDLVVTYLESMGLVVERPTKYAYKTAVDIAATKAHRAQLEGQSDSVSDDLSFSKVIPFLLDELDSQADIVAMSNIVIRTGRYRGASRIEWDGVRRQEKGTFGSNMTGAVPTASLESTIYSRDGVRIFSGYGGLDLIFKLNIPAKKYELWDDRLTKPKLLAEGVCVSFHPFFGLADNC